MVNRGNMCASLPVFLEVLRMKSNMDVYTHGDTAVCIEVLELYGAIEFAKSLVPMKLQCHP